MTANRLVAALATLAVLLGVLAPARAGVDRPPQFVVMAFDNCTELERWQELIDFAAELNRDGDRIHFTFFVSGSNFIADSRRSTQPPECGVYIHLCGSKAIESARSIPAKSGRRSSANTAGPP